MAHLRPDLVIRQEFSPAATAAAETSLPALLMGVQRAFTYKEDLGVSGWSAAAPLVPTAFPGWQGGAVEASGALAPKLWVSTTDGVAELPATFTNLATSPQVSLASGVSATFDVASGTVGTFTLNVSDPKKSTFTDTGSDFIVAQVADGAQITVDGLGVLEVAPQGLKSASELEVIKLDKGAVSAGAAGAAAYTLSAEDADGLRTVSTTYGAFVDAGGFTKNASVGDKLTVDYHTVADFNLGVAFTAVDGGSNILIGAVSTAPAAGDRELTIGAAGGKYDTASPAAWDNANNTGGVWFLANSQGDFEPAFYATSIVADDNQSLFAKDYATNNIADALASDDGRIAQWYNYADTTAASIRGEFTLLSGGQRTFTDTSGIDFTSGAFALVAGSLGDHILIKDTDGVYRPVFRIESIDSPTQLTVSQFGSAVGAAVVAAGVDYKIARPTNYTTGAVAGDNLEGEDATLSGSGGGVYSLTALTHTFTTTVLEGDLLFSPAGELLGIVDNVGSPTTISVTEHPNAGASLADFAGSSFGFSIRRGGLPAEFIVKQIIDASTLLVAADPGSPNTIVNTATISGFLSFQTAPVAAAGVVSEFGAYPDVLTIPDSVGSLNWAISKTVSGADLSGSLLLSYVEVKQDTASSIVQVSSADLSTLGPAVPENPIGMAAAILAANTDAPFYVLQVATDDMPGWTAALEVAKTDEVYQLVPLTQDETILSSIRAHVDEQSLPNSKHERILWQSGLVPTQVQRLAVTAADGSTVERDSVGVETVVLQQDTTSAGVVVGDTFTGQASDGTSLISFSGVISSVSVTGAVTTLQLVPGSEFALGTPALPLITYSIDSAELSKSQHAAAVAAYAAAIQDRRVRNIFPEQVKVTATDTTGFFVDESVSDKSFQTTVGAHFAGAMLAGQRMALGPVLPLTARVGAGIDDVVDPFLGDKTTQDVVIDGGNNYLENSGGAGVSSIRALTTDVTDLKFLEESVTIQVDSFTRKLRSALKPLIGRYIIDQRFFDMVSITQQSVRQSVLDAKELKAVVLDKIEQDPLRADGFKMTYTLDVYFSGAHGDVTLFA